MTLFDLMSEILANIPLKVSTTLFPNLSYRMTGV